MSERFNDITSKADAPYLAGNFGIGNLCESTEATMANVSLKEDNILGGFKSFITEVEKMKRFGFTEAEVNRAKDNILAGYEKAANQADTRKNSEYVWPLIKNFFDNEAYMEPKAEYEMAKAILGQISSPVINQVIAQGMTGENLSVIYTGPEKAGIATPSKDDLLNVLKDVESAEIEAPKEENSNVALMDPSSLKGSAVAKTTTFLSFH